MKRRDKGKLPPFVPLLVETMRSPAWRALSHGARSLYVGLKSHYDLKNHNNGRLFLSQRDAATELGSHHNEIARWYRELQHYGFIVMETAAIFGVTPKGQAPRWRLTELGFKGDSPTRDFQRWDGTLFRPKRCAPFPARGVRENQHTSVRHFQHTKNENRAPFPAQRDSGKVCAISSTELELTTTGSDLAVSNPPAITAQRRQLNDLSARLAVFAPIGVLPGGEVSEMGRL